MTLRVFYLRISARIVLSDVSTISPVITLSVRRLSIIDARCAQSKNIGKISYDGYEKAYYRNRTEENP